MHLGNLVDENLLLDIHLFHLHLYLHLLCQHLLRCYLIFRMYYVLCYYVNFWLYHVYCLFASTVPGSRLTGLPRSLAGGGSGPRQDGRARGASAG